MMSGYLSEYWRMTMKTTTITSGTDARNMAWLVERADTTCGRVYLFTNDTFTRALMGDEPDTLTDVDFDGYDPATSEIAITESTAADLARLGLQKEISNIPPLLG